MRREESCLCSGAIETSMQRYKADNFSRTAKEYRLCFAVSCVFQFIFMYRYAFLAIYLCWLSPPLK